MAKMLKVYSERTKLWKTRFKNLPTLQVFRNKLQYQCSACPNVKSHLFVIKVTKNLQVEAISNSIFRFIRSLMAAVILNAFLTAV